MSKVLYKLLPILFILWALLLIDRDASASTYIQGPALIQQGTTTAKATSTTTLTKDSQTYQMFIGTNTQTVALPNATTIPQGRRFVIINAGSSGFVTVQDGSGATVGTIAGMSTNAFYLRDNGTIAGTWYIDINSIPSNFTSGSILFADGSGTIAQDNANFFWDDVNNRLNIGTNISSSDISLGGDVARTIRMESGIVADTAGFALTLRSGGATSLATDKAGGTLALSSGISTGTGSSQMSFLTATPQTSTSTSSNNPTIKMTILGSGFVGIGNTNPTALFQLGGARTGTPSSSGEYFVTGVHTFTDTGTAASGTVASYASSVIGAVTLVASATAVTTTLASSLRINGPIVPSTNETITTDVALDISSTAIGSGAGSAVNGVGLRVAAPTGATTGNYAAQFTGNVGMGAALDPQAPLDIFAQGVTLGTSEQLSLRSQRAAIVSGNMISGVSYRSNDTNLTAPGTIVAYESAVAEATHTASVLDTGLAFYTTQTLSLAERLRISASGVLTASAYGAGALQSSAGGVFSSSVLTIANGGTNSTATATAGGIGYGTGTAHAYTSAGTSQNWVLSGGAGAPTMSNTTTTGKMVDGSADENQLIVQGNATQTNDVVVVEKSDGTDLMLVTNVNGTKIRGTTTNDTAAVGFVGEIMSNINSGAANNMPATNTIGCDQQLVITAGSWLLTANLQVNLATATITQGPDMWISTTSGNSATGRLDGVNTSYAPTTNPANPAAAWTLSVSNYPIQLSASTTYYLKCRISYSLGQPTYNHSFYAIRLR